MKQKFLRIVRDMRQQPLVSTVTFIATVLSIFLFMAVVITTRVKVVPFAPESCRNRLLMGRYIHIKAIEGDMDSSGGMSDYIAHKLYYGLEGVECASCYQSLISKTAAGTEGKYFNVFTRLTDADFFKVFDHKLIAGRYYTPEEAASNLPMAVISERTARRAFGTVDCVGQSISINHRKHTVTGVVSDHSFLATNACGDVFMAHGYDENPDPFGDTTVALLVKDGVDFSSVRDQVKARYAEYDTELRAEGRRAIFHESPFDQATIAGGVPYSNGTPDSSSDNYLRLGLYALLLLVPAINLSSLLHSRMRKRISEIGVRRAFGCTRMRVITDIVWENFLVTLVGGLVGVALGITFAMTYSGMYENWENYGSGIAPSLEAVINWGTIGIAVGVCFILNLLSASVPAWQASRLNPVEAINAK